MNTSRNWPGRVLLASALVVVAAGPAAAQSERPAGWLAGAFGVNVDVGVNLSVGETGDPVTVSPDVWYTPGARLRLVLAHSPQASGGFYGTSGYPTAVTGLCISGEASGCVRVYDQVAAGADYWAVLGDYNVLAWGRAVARSFDAGFYGATVGVSLGRALSGGKLMVGANPNLYVGFTKRGDGNKEILTVPLHAMYAISAKFMLGLQSGVSAPVNAIKDGFRLPLGLGGRVTTRQDIAIGVMFNLFSVTGGNSVPSGPDARALSVMVSWTR